MACDIHFKKVSLLLDFDGTNGSTTFTDMSNAGNVLTPQNGAAVSTTAPKFGTGCLPTAVGYLTAPSVSGDSLDLKSGDFTVECWIKLNSGPVPGNACNFLSFGVPGTSGVQMGVFDNGGGLIALYASWQSVALGAGSTSGISGALGFALNTWYAVCVERIGTNISLFIDGVLVVTATLGSGPLVGYTQLTIGRDNINIPFDGEVDELRVTKGYARYVAAAVAANTYTVSTSAFGEACVTEQPVVAVDENTTPGTWATFLTFVGSDNITFSDYTYDPPTWQDTDCNVAVLFALSFVTGSTSDILTPSNVTATYGGHACQVAVRNINPANGSYTTQRCTLLLLCLLPAGGSFSSDGLHITYAGMTSALTIFATLGATALLVDPAYQLTVPETFTDTCTISPFSFIIPAFSAPINHLMVSTFNCAVSGPGTPAAISSPTFQVDSDTTTGVPLAIGNRSLAAGGESDAVSWNYTPTPITVGGGQFFWGDTFSLPPVPFGTEVPSVIGDTPSAADAEITGAGFVVGVVTIEPSNLTPAGTVFSQNPAGGFLADPGSAVDYIVSSGPAPAFVPNIVGETVSQANSDITGNGFQVGATSTAHSDTVPAGIVISQSPAAGTQAALGTFISYVISSGPQPPPPPTTGVKFNFEATVISQYANSPTLLQLCSNMNDYVDQSTNFATFFDFIWNVNTAQGFGLDIWGKIVNISRLLTIPNTSRNFGFKDNVTPPDYDPFNVSPFNSKGGAATQTYLLNDAAYRTLILTKALSNISATTAPAINQLLRNLFPGRGRCYVLDLGGMAMQFTFEFQLTVTEFAILAQSKALPRPAGVAVNIVTLSGGSVLGFAEAGGSAESFGFGHFY